jgi:hypothetical protein
MSPKDRYCRKNCRHYMTCRDRKVKHHCPKVAKAYEALREERAFEWRAKELAKAEKVFLDSDVFDSEALSKEGWEAEKDVLHG